MVQGVFYPQEEGSHISHVQFGAISRAVEGGLELKQRCPKRLVQLRNQGLSYSNITKTLGLTEKNHHFTNKQVAESAVGFALRGHNGGYGTPAYQGLLQEPSSVFAPWSKAEIKDIRYLAGEGCAYNDITILLNDAFHDGENVRTHGAVRAKLSRTRHLR